MVVDTSAVLAILQDGPERPRFTAAIAESDQRSMSVATLLEVAIVVEARFGVDGGRPSGPAAGARWRRDRSGG